MKATELRLLVNSLQNKIDFPGLPDLTFDVHRFGATLLRHADKLELQEKAENEGDFRSTAVSGKDIEEVTAKEIEDEVDRGLRRSPPWHPGQSLNMMYDPRGISKEFVRAMDNRQHPHPSLERLSEEAQEYYKIYGAETGLTALDSILEIPLLLSSFIDPRLMAQKRTAFGRKSGKWEREVRAAFSAGE